jgi:hypothetical protein
MIVTLEMSPDSEDTIRRHATAAEAAMAAMAEALEAAVFLGADTIREGLIRGAYGLTMRRPASGLAASVTGWMIDAEVPVAALGVPSNAPAARYASIHNTGGTIRPRNARALAVPTSDEARQYSSPRDMADLTFIPRESKPPLLARVIGEQLQVHWVLMSSVTIPATHWFDRGVADAMGPMTDAFQGVMDEYAQKWN